MIVDRILMRDRYIPSTAISAPNGMVWEYIVVPKGIIDTLKFLTDVCQISCDQCVNLHLVTSIMCSSIAYTIEKQKYVEIHYIHGQQVITMVREHKVPVDINNVYPQLYRYRFLGAQLVETASRNLQACCIYGLPARVPRYHAKVTAHIYHLIALPEKYSQPDPCQHYFFLRNEQISRQSPMSSIDNHDRRFVRSMTTAVL